MADKVLAELLKDARDSTLREDSLISVTVALVEQVRLQTIAIGKLVEAIERGVTEQRRARNLQAGYGSGPT